MLPREWPLARMSVSIRRVSVLLRVTLLRRLAELSFRGHDFVDLPKEVVREVRRDVDGICNAVAIPLAELFCFLRRGRLLQHVRVQNVASPRRCPPDSWSRRGTCRCTGHRS